MLRTFLYFAYGSNLLADRIHINNPSAVNKGIGKLKDFRLDFNGYSNTWKGAPATIVPTTNDSQHVWGVIWEIDNSNLSYLDRQEGVEDKVYFPMNVDIENIRGDVLKCRVYQQCNNPNETIALSDLPNYRRPSPLYLKTIIKGAKENLLPNEYIEFLESIPHNNYTGAFGINLDLN